MWPTFNGNAAIHVVVETPRGSAVKFDYDANLAAFTLSRLLPLGTVYPFFGVCIGQMTTFVAARELARPALGSPARLPRLLGPCGRAALRNSLHN